ncbi:MAG: hypothetical protein B6D39_11490 [Anaerolineae bacterium UTCFX2]|nr:hypothetical protein [Anaerolineae bacterium]MCZ7553612.1 hypothetical protein [Anaerolineales bacterium]OQY88287.1 MAG: hypothetical protein B6D39_11490 [Anaerolineae bacterium UTCFX2]
MGEKPLELDHQVCIVFDHWGNLTVGPERAIPFARYCAQTPEHRGEVIAWLRANHKVRYSDRLEIWTLRRLPQVQIEDAVMRQVIELLRHGPQPYWRVREQVGPLAPVLVEQMIDLEIIERVGLTPTDLLHTSGEFAAGVGFGILHRSIQAGQERTHQHGADHSAPGRIAPGGEFVFECAAQPGQAFLGEQGFLAKQKIDVH